MDNLGAKAFSYSAPGCTSPSVVAWVGPGGYRLYERTIQIGNGDAVWRRASSAMKTWAIKSRSGFRVSSSFALGDVVVGDNAWLVARFWSLQIREPVRIVEVVDEPHRCGFSYGTLTGHPVSGEEAFIVHRSGDSVFFTLRSATRAGRGGWFFIYPLILVAQRFYRRRYMAAASALGR